MKISDRIYELISGKLNDALSAEEERELAGWLEADGEHEVIFEEMRKLHTQAKLLRREFTPDVEGTLRKLKGHGRKQVGMRVWFAVGDSVGFMAGVEGRERETTQAIQHGGSSGVGTGGFEAF